MKPSIPKGTRDMNPAEMQKRNFIFDTIKKQFQLFGFEQIETPAMENLSSLTGKYGEEGDQLLFKILNSRIHESKNKETLQKEFSLSLEQARNSDVLTERALRYDLTVPFARYVVMHQHEITFPFRRFQIQPVWRADKPQKGRYREFYQCDADMIGSQSLLNEIELIKLMDEVFSGLNIPVCIKLNNRKKEIELMRSIEDEKQKLRKIQEKQHELNNIYNQQLHNHSSGQNNLTTKNIIYNVDAKRTKKNIQNKSKN
jgi:histidyl-tRNA synthetase